MEEKNKFLNFRANRTEEVCQRIASEIIAKKTIKNSKTRRQVEAEIIEILSEFFRVDFRLFRVDTDSTGRISKQSKTKFLDRISGQLAREYEKSLAKDMKDIRKQVRDGTHVCSIQRIRLIRYL